ncbi:hypothetical protein [Nocardia macrotermitis]|uniref:Uncharacterized protein n=1 Tax=Nocardia macrotermitis TaxID=2585198 RepID=A0A7K0DEL4_9NOCA|nr:hypothetical protein [Nocardia macrotermitis]MQY24236.1 hypothetical protein [Nocardia macrotermitis]
MGTSTRWPGPKNGVWRGPNIAFGKVGKLSSGLGGETAPFEPAVRVPAAETAVEDRLRRAILQCLSALRDLLEADPDAYDLIPTMVRTGNNLLDVLTEISTGTDLLADSSDDADRRTRFVQVFTERVVGVAAAPADAVARAAAVRSARKLLQNSNVAAAIDRGAQVPLPDDLFCAIYELFLKSMLTEFIAGIAAAKLNLALPFLYLIDPGGKIAEWIADGVTEHILDPCAERGDSDDISLADLGRDLLEENVRRVLGLPIES